MQKTNISLSWHPLLSVCSAWLRRVETSLPVTTERTREKTGLIIERKRSLSLIYIWFRLLISYPVSVACSMLFPDRFHIRSSEGTDLVPGYTRAGTPNLIDFLFYWRFPMWRKQWEQIESSVRQEEERNKREKTFHVHQPSRLQRSLCKSSVSIFFSLFLLFAEICIVKFRLKVQRGTVKAFLK